MTAVALGPADEARWVSFLAGRDDALVFHHPSWLQAITSCHGYDALVLGHEDAAGTLNGVLPLVRKHGVVTGRRLVSLPHSPLAGPVGDHEACEVLAAAALETARSEGARLELKTRPGVLHGGTPWSTTFVKGLPEDPSQLRFGDSRNHGRIKWAVRKASREGVAVRDAHTEADLRAWYDLYLPTMRAHTVPPRSFAFFLALWRRLRPGGLLRLVLAERGGRLLAGSVFLMFGATVFYAYNGRRQEALVLRPNDLIQWHAIHAASEEGFRHYDFGEVEDDQKGLAEFKRKWGAEPEQLHRYVRPSMPAAADARRLEHARHWGERAWRRMPLAATVRVGEFAYRRL